VYHRADGAVIERIAHRLKRHGVDPWLDSWYLSAGVNWQRELAETLTACGCCAVFVGASALGVWEQQELEVALDRAARDRNYQGLHGVAARDT